MGNAAVHGGRWATRGRGRGAALLMAAAVGAATLGGGCARASEDDAIGADLVAGDVDFEATAAFLSEASQRSAGQAHRVETRMAMRISGTGTDVDTDVPYMSGEVDGDAYAFHMDMSDWIGALADASGGSGGQVPADRMTADVAGDAEALYLRGPLFALTAQSIQPGPQRAAVEDLAAVEDQWGRVDLAALAGTPLGEIQQATGASAAGDPRALLDLVRSAGDVRELGSDEIDGNEVHGAAGTVTMAQMLESQGTDPEAYTELLMSSLTGGGGADEDELARFAEAMVDSELPLEVWIDGQGYVRRIAYDIDVLSLLDSVTDLGADAPDELSMGSQIDYSGYGDGSIDVELPADALDVTDAYLALLDL